MRKATIQALGAIVSGIMSSAGLSLGILGFLNNTPLVVRWLPLIILLLFFGFVLWAWRDMKQKIQELDEKLPKVKILKIHSAEWSYNWSYLTPNNPDSDVDVHGIRLLIHLKLINDGQQATNIRTFFKSDDDYEFYPSGSPFQARLEYNPSSEEVIAVEGQGKLFDGTITFNRPMKGVFPKRGTTIIGLLKLEPWGNKILTQRIECKDGNCPDLDDRVVKKIQEFIK